MHRQPVKRKGKGKMSVSYRNQTKPSASTISYFSSSEISAIMSVFSQRENEVLDMMKRDLNGHGRYRPRLIMIKRQRLMFMMGLELGARVSEIVHLRWAISSSFDWDRKIVTVYDQKKDVERSCTMPDKLWEELRTFRNLVDLRKEAWVFGISEKTANRWIKDWAKAAGIKRRVRWHMMRHTHVVQSRRAGRDWDWISQQTGDSVATLIKWYSRLSLEDRHEIGNVTNLMDRV